MSKLHRLLLACIGLGVVCGGPQLNATETIFAGTPVYSVMSTVNTELTLPTSGANAFMPRQIPCPAAAGANGCTFRVTVTSEIDSTAPLEAYLQVTTAPFMTVSPAPVVHIFRSLNPAAPFSMQWAIKNVPAGSSPEVQVIGLSHATSSATFLEKRTLSIDVFYGFL
jgi:hypothetical protein